jgi:hypothetical protein
MTRIKPPDLGHVVQDFYSGKSHIMICDDYCAKKTKEEIDVALARIADIAVRDYCANKDICN